MSRPLYSCGKNVRCSVGSGLGALENKNRFVVWGIEPHFLGSFISSPSNYTDYTFLTASNGGGGGGDDDDDDDNNNNNNNNNN